MVNDMDAFRTSLNTVKFYWKGSEKELDYPNVLIGTRTPTLFIWTKMEHLYSIMSREGTSKGQKIIVGGDQEYTPLEFMKIVSGARMWTFDRTLM